MPRKVSGWAIPGEDLDGIYRGLDYLRQLNLGKPVKLGERVAVIGGGNVAMDAVRSARRLGSERAFILYRRGLEEMPSTPEEIKQCREERIPIKTLAQPVRFISNNGRVKSIECVKTRLTEPDESGRRKPEPIPGFGVYGQSRCRDHSPGTGIRLVLFDARVCLYIDRMGNHED